MGKIHLSCLQRWLGSSNKTRCEICDFQFTLERKTKPFRKFLANPGSPRDKRNLICDIICFSLLMPFTIATAWLCITNAVHLNLPTWESVGLFSLALCLLIIFCFWATICIKHNYNTWKDWSQFHQDVKLKCQPPPAVPNSQRDQSTSGARGHPQLTAVEIPIYRRQLPPSHRSPQAAVRTTHCRNTGMTLSPPQSNHSNSPTGVKGERLSNQCWSPKSGYNARSFQDSAFQNSTVKQELFPGMRRNTAAGQRSISPAYCNLTACNNPKCLDNEQNRRKCFSPRPNCTIEGEREHIPRVNSNTLSGQRSSSPSLGNQSNDFRGLNQENILNQYLGPRSPNFVRKQESSDQISSIRSNASSGRSSEVYYMPSVTDSSSRSIEFIQHGQTPRSSTHHPRETSVSTEQATGGSSDPIHYNPNQPRHSRTGGYETYV
ncbi:E3 ubiquitin-protein ligase 3-Mar [Mizuhopecten yessoensis]|uniref:E3 ubiquitin-protein ligase 3-Mar n=2 Tax=Mizuhopecten yessoensis TaxID=6573 RepID=A0A210R5G2_MIZYE|nr:E3 ubiquitin-protein ligase 3-Mar [Mizuhopecten yessoensis]